ncbi:MAG: YidC/Oxa1 family membrane protein insertase, partial [Eubacterium sp.]
MQVITTPLGYVMHFCYNLVSNYAFAIILFTLFTKVILFPVSLWTHKNSIKLVKIQPQLNHIKAKFYGEKDKISDEQLVLYKKEKYHPFAGMIPMIIQVVLLMFVIEIIYNPLTYILHMDSSVISQLINDVSTQFNLNPQDNSIQLSVVKEIQNGFQTGGYDLSAVKALNMSFLGFDLAAIPFKSKGIMLLMPIFAGASALLLCVFQSKMNPLQAEQNKFEQTFTSVISVGISLILGGFVPAGIGFYWICSNIFAMLQQLILNVTINPKKHIDYEELEKSRQELAKLDSYAKESKSQRNAKDRKKERADYKRFFSVANKHFVIYSEGSGYYKYFKPLVEYILNNSNIVIHYVTSDCNDRIFEKAQDEKNLKAYYIGEKKLISLFMKMDADIVVMSTPDLDNFHLK